MRGKDIGQPFPRPIEPEPPPPKLTTNNQKRTTHQPTSPAKRRRNGSQSSTVDLDNPTPMNQKFVQIEDIGKLQGEEADPQKVGSSTSTTTKTMAEHNAPIFKKGMYPNMIQSQAHKNCATRVNKPSQANRALASNPIP